MRTSGLDWPPGEQHCRHHRGEQRPDSSNVETCITQQRASSGRFGGRIRAECNRDIQRQERQMAIDPSAIGRSPLRRSTSGPTGTLCSRSVSEPAPRIWLPHHREQSRHPAAGVAHLAVICCMGFGAAPLVGKLQLGQAAARLAGGVPLSAPCRRRARCRWSQGCRHPGQGRGQRTPSSCCGPAAAPATGVQIAETLTTLVIRGDGGFGGQPGQRPSAPEFPDREPDARIALPTREDQALLTGYPGTAIRCCNLRVFARELAGFPADPCTAWPPTVSPVGPC